MGHKKAVSYLGLLYFIQSSMRKKHGGKSFAVLLTEVLISNYHPAQIIFQILQWWEMHEDPSRNLAHNTAVENFSFMKFDCCDSATYLCGRNSLDRTNFSNILNFAEICSILEVTISKGNASRRNVEIASRVMRPRQMPWNCRISKTTICSQVKLKSLLPVF